MQTEVRRRITLGTGVLTVVSLAAVLAAVRQAIPDWLLPALPETVLAAIPHANALISAIAILIIVSGWRSIRAGDVQRHRQAMLAGLALFLTFLGLYLLRVAIEGPTPFSGPEWLQLWFYYPILAIHMLLAMGCLPLLYYVLLFGVTHDPSELGETPHARVGRIAVSLWLTSFALGIVVYLLLYVIPF